METIPVVSSNIEEIGYEETDNTLFITFKSGGKYKYEDVPVQVWNEFKGATSTGSFFHARIKGNYTYTQV